MLKKIAGVVLVCGVIWLGAVYLSHHTVAILSPKGTIAAQQKHLMVIAAIMMLIIVIPVFILTYTTAWRFRASNHKARHEPDWDGNIILETTWWAIPTILIMILAGITWTTSHTLDPFKPITNGAPTLTVQVVALQWKWLFIYPQQNIATVNVLDIPNNTPVNFQITSDAPMNSFWIPQLAGQIYAMPGMATQLNVMATSEGQYRGVSANISGTGFADMDFKVNSVSSQGFDTWVNAAQQTKDKLEAPEYRSLSQPGVVYKPQYYSTVSPGLFNGIMLKYMAPVGSNR